MSHAAEQLCDQALGLEEEERAELALRLMDSVGNSSPDIEQQWLAEARQRLADVDAERSTASTWSEARVRIFAPR